MKRVLLVTDSERVQRIFESLEAKGLLQLRTAATLAQEDLELSDFVPEFTFVQSRLFGFSGEIMSRHLKKNLPKGVKIVLLAADADDAVQAKEHAKSFIDLAVDDEALASAVNDTITGANRPAPKKAAKSHAEHAGKGQPGDAEDAESEQPSAAQAIGEGEADFAKESPAGTFLPGIEIPFAKVPDAGSLAPELAEERPADVPAQEVGQAGPESFEEMMRRASGTEGPAAAGPVFEEDRVNIGGYLSTPSDQPGAPVKTEWEEPGWQVPDDAFYHGEPLADAMLRAQKKKRPNWVLLALVLLSIPVVFYYVFGKSKAPRSSVAPANRPFSAQQSSRVPVAATPTVPTAKTKPAPGTAPVAVPAMIPTGRPAERPEAKPTAKPEAKQEAKPGVKALPAATAVPATSASVKKTEDRRVAGQLAKPAAKPAPEAAAKPAGTPPANPVAKAGLKALPPFVVGARLDETYGKTHPGWQRYVGAKAEYKLFREAGLYRAIQVIALGGETIPDQLFKRELRGFGAFDSFHIESTGKKGDYLVEQGVAKGGVAFTTYRKKSDLRLKGFVLYYR
jgi:hypothetical protein